MTHSAIPWTKSYPSHWSMTRIKYLARSERGAFTDGDWIETPFITQDGVRLIQCGNVGTGEYIEQGFKYISEDSMRSLNCTEVDPNDVLICRMRSSPRIRAGRACRVPNLGCRMITAVDNCILKPRPNVDPRFVVYQLSMPYFLDYVEGIARGGTRDRISRRMLGDFSVLLPPLNEQQAIAAFLDRETAKIDELIVKKQAMLGRLADRRSSVVSRAVTQGITSQSKTQPTNVDWLPTIPADWQWKRLKYVANLQTGLTLGKKYDDDIELVTRPYLRVANVQDGYLDLEHITTVEVPVTATARYELLRGDVLMTEGGDFDKLGRGYVWDGQIEGCLHQNHIFAVRPHPKVLDSHFLATLLSSLHGRNYFTSTAQQTTNLASTNSTKLRAFPIPLPPREDQIAIMGFIRTSCRSIDAAAESIRLACRKLREYRAALISAAVTGQIDVRNYRPEAPCP